MWWHLTEFGDSKFPSEHAMYVFVQPDSLGEFTNASDSRIRETTLIHIIAIGLDMSFSILLDGKLCRSWWANK